MHETGPQDLGRQNRCDIENSRNLLLCVGGGGEGGGGVCARAHILQGSLSGPSYVYFLCFSLVTSGSIQCLLQTNAPKN